jgi:hypothetical protein
MSLEPGKLYRIDKWSWFLFPSLETATATPRRCATGTGSPRGAALRATLASYWSKQLNCNVSFLNKEDTIMVVEVSGIQVKVINQEGKSGWINFPADEEWAEDTITEISNDA